MKVGNQTFLSVGAAQCENIALPPNALRKSRAFNKTIKEEAKKNHFHFA